jgi:hypothetical protein
VDSTVAPRRPGACKSRRHATRGDLLLVSALAVAACAVESDDVDEVTATDGEDGKADAASELRVRAGDTTVWMTRALARVTGEQGPEFVLRGRASRDLTDGNAYIFDDVYGEFGLRGPRSFEVRWVIRSNTAPLIEGVQQYRRSASSTARPAPITSPRARSCGRGSTASAGATSIYLTAELTPVVSTAASSTGVSRQVVAPRPRRGDREPRRRAR